MDIALFLRDLAAQHEAKAEYVKKANAIKGAKAIEALQDVVCSAKDCGKCPGIGKGTVEKIHAFLLYYTEP